MDKDSSHEESVLNFLTLPTELLVYIISFLSSICDLVKLRYVSSHLRCVIEETPSLWKEFVWPCYNRHEECCVKEVLKVCGQHIKVLSFPNSRVSSTLVEMLRYCSNVQHLSLLSANLDSEQLIKIIHHMRCLQILEVNTDDDIKNLLSKTAKLKELVISASPFLNTLEQLFTQWIELASRPSNFNIITDLRGIHFSENIAEFLQFAFIQLKTSPTVATGNFRVYNCTDKVPLKFSSTFPSVQLQFGASGQVISPCVKLSDFGILGLYNDVAVMTDCQYDGRTVYMVKYMITLKDSNNMNKQNSLPITRCGNLSCVTHFDFTSCCSLHSGHLEQLAIVCPNIQGLNLQNCGHCLKNLQGLQAVARQCDNLQGLNLLDIHYMHP